MALRCVDKRTDVLLRLQDCSVSSTNAEFLVLGIHTLKIERLDCPFEHALHFLARRELPGLHSPVERHRHFNFSAAMAVEVVFVSDAVIAKAASARQFFIRVFHEDFRVRVNVEASFLRDLKQIMYGRVFRNFYELLLGHSRAVEIYFDFFNHCIFNCGRGVKWPRQRNSKASAKFVKQCLLYACRIKQRLQMTPVEGRFV